MTLRTFLPLIKSSGQKSFFLPPFVLIFIKILLIEDILNQFRFILIIINEYLLTSMASIVSILRYNYGLQKSSVLYYTNMKKNYLDGTFIVVSFVSLLL